MRKLRKAAGYVKSKVWPHKVPYRGPGFPMVELIWWRPLDGSYNFGDVLSKVVSDSVLSSRGYTFLDGVKQERRMLAIGSVLHFARDGDAVWGSGINGKTPVEQHRFQNLDVRAVRGPLTAEFLRQRKIEVPEIFGDPALLVPELFPDRFRPTRTKPHVFVPNLGDLSLTRGMKNVVSPLLPWNECIRQILEAEFVMASSLHGVIIAEAFGIPARYVRLSDHENLFKYNDYAQGTGRPSIEHATSVDQALEMGGLAPISFDRAKLRDAFPFDLWE